MWCFEVGWLEFGVISIGRCKKPLQRRVVLHECFLEQGLFKMVRKGTFPFSNCLIDVLLSCIFVPSAFFKLDFLCVELKKGTSDYDVSRQSRPLIPFATPPIGWLPLNLKKA